MSAVTTGNAKIFSQLTSKSRSLAKISERRLQPEMGKITSFGDLEDQDHQNS